jgi:hypothetical protein
MSYAQLQPRHFLWHLEQEVALITLNRPERKNPLTFESYAELCDLFRGLRGTREVKAVVLSGAGANFCSGGDVHEIIGPLTRMAEPELLKFTRMTGDLVLQMRLCPQPIIAASRRGVRRSGSVHRDGGGYAPRHASGAHGIPVCTRGTCRLRYGCLPHPAAHHRAGARRGAALHGPRHDGRGGRELGLL